MTQKRYGPARKPRTRSTIHQPQRLRSTNATQMTRRTSHPFFKGKVHREETGKLEREKLRKRVAGLQYIKANRIEPGQAGLILLIRGLGKAFRQTRSPNGSERVRLRVGACPRQRGSLRSKEGCGCVTPIRDVIEDIESSLGCEVGLAGEFPGRYRYGWRFCVL